MKFTAGIDIMPQPELLDPPGKAAMRGLEHLGLEQVADVRIGKHISLELEAENQQAAQDKRDQACRKLPANLIMEFYALCLIHDLEPAQ